MKEKIIKIKNKDDLNNFYKRLKWYKYYRNTKFISKNKEIKDVIEALNIKNYKKRIEYIYNQVCDDMDKFYFSIDNICSFKNNKCMVQQTPKCKLINGCCRRCIYQSSSGCPKKNLSCKLHFCKPMRKKYDIPEIKDIPLLRLFSFRQRVIAKYNYFTPYKLYLIDLYIMPLPIFYIIRFIRYIFISDIIFKWKKEG